MNVETKIRTSSQRTQILNCLRTAGSKGVTNVQLSDIGFRYNARLQELYTEGYRVQVDELGNGITRYILLSEPEKKNAKPEDALDILIRDIDRDSMGIITTGELRYILEDKGFTIRRKIGSFNK